MTSSERISQAVAISALLLSPPDWIFFRIFRSQAQPSYDTAKAIWPLGLAYQPHGTSSGNPCNGPATA